MTTQDIREKLSLEINSAIKDITRKLTTSYSLGFEDGQIITSEKADSWTDGGVFDEGTDDYVYILRAVNEVPVHVVDYDNEEEVYELSAVSDEKEVLVKKGSKFKVVNAGLDEDMNDCGFIEIEVEYIG